MGIRAGVLFIGSVCLILGLGILIGWNIKPATMVIDETPVAYYINTDGIPTTQDVQTPSGSGGGLTFTTIHYYPQLCYLYGIPYWQLQMPKTPYYTLAQELMPFTEANIEAGFAVEDTNIDGTTEVYIPVSLNTMNVSRAFGK